MSARATIRKALEADAIYTPVEDSPRTSRITLRGSPQSVADKAVEALIDDGHAIVRASDLYDLRTAVDEVTGSREEAETR